jgi:hypothetical protein
MTSKTSCYENKLRIKYDWFYNDTVWIMVRKKSWVVILMSIIDLQLLIMFYKSEVKRDQNNIANHALLTRSRNKLKEVRWKEKKR